MPSCELKSSGLTYLIVWLIATLSEYGSRFSAQDYISAGYPSYAPGRVAQIAQHDLAQTKFLIDALGPTYNNVLPCTYNFTFINTPQIFVEEASRLKQVVTSAYTGSLQFLDSQYSRATGAIALTEGRDQAFIQAVMLKGAPFT